MRDTVRPVGTYYDIFNTALGWVAVSTSDAGVTRTSLPERTSREAMDTVAASLGGAVHDPDGLATLRDLITRYCAGEPVDLTSVQLDTSGASPFFVRAWQACRSVPRGETRTYAWLAEISGSPRAARGAGQAMARNPYPLLVPCHRIVGSDGGLHGFGGGIGLPMKEQLLKLEAADVKAQVAAA